MRSAFLQVKVTHNIFLTVPLRDDILFEYRTLVREKHHAVIKVLALEVNCYCRKAKRVHGFFYISAGLPCFNLSKAT